MSFTPLDNKLLESFVDRLPDGPLQTARRDALARFAAAGLPTTKDEDWRYTNLADIAAIGNRWLQALHGSADPSVTNVISSSAARDQVDACWIEFLNGRITKRSIEGLDSLQEAGVEVRQLSASNEPQTLYTGDAITSLNAALAAEPLHIRITSDHRLSKPIGLLFAGESTAATMAGHTRIIIDIAVGASADVIEAHQSGGEHDYFASSVAEVNAGARSTMRYLKLQECEERHSQIGQLRVTLDEAATFEHFSLDIGGHLVRNDVMMLLQGPEATASTSGLYLAHGVQHIDNHLHAEHAVGPARSQQNYRGIASGRARCVFNGKAVVREGADGTDAEQSNHNLLLSERAEIDTKPELEIYADDVKCSHGATIGQLDEAAIFYLRSRGLDRDQAAQVLTRAFASRVVSAVPIDAARAYVEQAVDRQLDMLVEENNGE